MRSRFVHGEFEVHHPALIDTFDNSINEYILTLSKASDLGYCILLATLQKMILNGWKKIIFYEMYGGEN